MNRAVIHFQDALQDLLPRGQRDAALTISFNPGQTVKHLAESLGVPHTEIHTLLVNGHPVDFDYQVQDGDRVDLYPVQAQEPALPAANPVCFILDNHLGRLAVYLRMLGFDVLYRNDYGDDELAHVCDEQGRTLLTRDKRLLMRKQVRRGYWVRSTIPHRQLAEVVARFCLGGSVQPFKRCLRCNELLQPVQKEVILHRLEPLTRQYFDEFSLCPSCDQVYWKGSHYARMLSMIQAALGEPASSEVGENEIPVGGQVVDGQSQQEHTTDGIDQAGA